MIKKRTNFKAMDCRQFIAYLKDNDVVYEQTQHMSQDNTKVIQVKPQHFRLVPRNFDEGSGKQIEYMPITGVDTKLLSSFVKVVDEKINTMSTKGVYHPRRLKPKWDGLTDNKDKLELFTKYMKAPTSSIGFIRLMMVNLPNKTLESILIDYPQYESLIDIEGVRQRCIGKFKAYKNGKAYLKSKGID